MRRQDLSPEPWTQDSTHHHSQSYSRREQNLGSEPSSSGGGDAGGVAGSGSGFQNDYVTGIGQSSDGSSSESMGVRPVGWNVSDRKQVTCFGCGELGHIRPNCPNRIRRVIAKDAVPGLTVEGFLAGVEVKGLMLDTGSGRTLVHKDFIPGAAYTGKNVRLDSWRGGQFSRHRLARIAIKIGSVEEMAEVVVVDTLDCPAILGINLGGDLRVRLLSMMLEKAEAAHADCDKNVVTMQEEELVVKTVRATRAQVDKVKVEEEQDAIAAAQSECDPLPLSEIFDFSDGFFEQDPLPGFCEKNDESCVLVEEQSQIVEDQADELTFGQVENDSVKLADVFDFSDSYFELDPVPTSISELNSEPEEEFGDIPLPKGGRIVSESSWQSSGLTGFDQRFMHHYAKATRGLAPDWVALINELLFLFLRVLLWALSFLTFSMFVTKFFVQQVVGGVGLSSVLRAHGNGEDLPVTVPSGGFLPRTGIGGGVFSATSLRHPDGGGDVMRSPQEQPS